MGKFIEEFYYGNLDPQARSRKQNKTVQKQMEVPNKITLKTIPERCIWVKSRLPGLNQKKLILNAHSANIGYGRIIVEFK